MDYICLGQSTLDYNWSVSQIPTAGSKSFADDFFTAGGGMAATAAVAIARLGGDVAFWGRAGDDTAGHLMKDELQIRGVNVEQFRLIHNARSPVASVIVDEHGERQISTFRGNNLPDDSSWLPLQWSCRPRAVLADMRWPAGAAELFTHARRKGVPTILDGDIAAARDYPPLLEHCDYALFSSQGLLAFAPDCDVKDALNRVIQHGCKVAAVTNGSEGTLWLEDDSYHHTPALEVKVVDTTGAGDVFHGAFTLHIGEGHSCNSALEFATVAAAIKCGQPGGRDGIPDRQQLQAIVEISQ